MIMFAILVILVLVAVFVGAYPTKEQKIEVLGAVVATLIGLLVCANLMVYGFVDGISPLKDLCVLILMALFVGHILNRTNRPSKEVCA